MCDTPTEANTINQGDVLEAVEEATAGESKVTPRLSGIDPVRISEGDYILRSGTGIRVLDIEGNSDADEANAQLYHVNGTDAQIFSMVWDPEAQAMTIRHAGLCLSKDGADGVGNVWQQTDTGSKAQRWLFEPVDGEDGWYYIRNLYGFYLDVDVAVDADCTNVKCWEFNGSPAQKWKLVYVSGYPAARVPDGEYVLRSVTGKGVLDIEGNSDAETANARLCHADGTAAQIFGVAYDKATCGMTIRHAGMYLDKEGGDGIGNVWQYKGNGTLAQRWFFEALPGEAGLYFIRDLFGYYLGAGDPLDDGTYNVACQVVDGSPSQQWRLGTPSLDYATVTLPESTFAFGGSPVEPAVSVILGSKALEEGVDYDVAYKNNDRVGTASLTVSGTGAYKGSAKVTFEILPASLEAATVTPAKASCSYSGKEIKPKVTVTLGDVTLEKDADYDVVYDNSIEMGLAGITVTGKGNYEGCASGTFEIVAPKTSLKKAKVTPEDSSYAYTGAAIEPPVSVTLKGNTLVQDTDYTVSYVDNTDAGTATVVVAGAGAYKGSAKATFKIAPVSLKRATIKPAKSICIYTGCAIKVPVTVTLDDVTLQKGVDYVVAYDDNRNVGTAEITVAGKGNYKGAAKAAFKIILASLSTATVTPAKEVYAYAYKAVKPDVTVVLNGMTLHKGTDYTVAYADNTCVGTATVTVKGKGNFEGAASGTFRIVPAKVALTKATQGKSLTVAWEAQGGVSGYQVQYATDPEFTQVKKTTDVLGALSTNVKDTDLPKDDTHYVRIRAYKDLPDMRYYSAWSAAKKVKAK